MQNHTCYVFRNLFVFFFLIFRKKFMRVARAGTKRNDTRQPSDETIYIVVSHALDGNRYNNVTCEYDSYARKHALLSPYILQIIVSFKNNQTQIKKNALLLFV